MHSELVRKVNVVDLGLWLLRDEPYVYALCLSDARASYA